MSGLPVAVAALAGSGVRVDEWRRFSRVTPWRGVLKMWSFVCLAAMWFFRHELENGEAIQSLRDLLVGTFASMAGKVCAVLAAASLVSALVAWIAWRHAFFALVEDGIHLRKGVLWKRHAHLRWDRVQTVTIKREFFARLFGLGSLTVTSASSDSEGIGLGLLERRECEELRQAILAASDRARKGRPIALPAWREGAAVPEDPAAIYRLDARRLLLSRLFSPQTFGGLLSVAGSILLLAFESGIAAIPLLFIVVGALWSAIRSTARNWGTEVDLAHEGIRWRSGLTSIGMVVFPPGRVHAIGISQPLPWRRWGWWRLSVLVAGREEFDQTSVTNMPYIVPVGSRGEMETMIWALLPDLGVQDPQAFLEEAFEGGGSSGRFLAAPRASRLVDPFGWRRNGIALTDTVAVLRRGKILGRSVRIIHHDRFQGLSLRSGPVSRRLGLADLRFETVGMRLSIVQRHLSREDATRTLDRELGLGRSVRTRGGRESIERWRLRVGAAPPREDAPNGGAGHRGGGEPGGAGQSGQDAVALAAGSSRQRDGLAESRGDDA